MMPFLLFRGTNQGVTSHPDCNYNVLEQRLWKLKVIKWPFSNISVEGKQRMLVCLEWDGCVNQLDVMVEKSHHPADHQHIWSLGLLFHINNMLQFLSLNEESAGIILKLYIIYTCINPSYTINLSDAILSETNFLLLFYFLCY